MDCSHKTTTLGEIASIESLPCVVKVCEEIMDGISPFSSGDLIKIDSSVMIDKIRGRFVEWEHSTGSYEETVDHVVSIPVAYDGFVQVLPKRGPHYVYCSIQDLITDMPRYVITVDHISSKRFNIPKDEVLEIISFNPQYHTSDPFLQFRNLEARYFQIPLTTKGRFEVLPDEMEYTLREVNQRFPLPQIVQFTELISKEQLPVELEDAIVDLKSFNRKFMLEKVYSEQVLSGQYKSGHSDPVTGESRRAAILIPLSNSDLQQTLVQYPLQKDSAYKTFVTENFPETNSVHQFLDDKLKFESINRPYIQFCELEPSPREEAVPDIATDQRFSAKLMINLDENHIKRDVKETCTTDEPRTILEKPTDARDNQINQRLQSRLIEMPTPSTNVINSNDSEEWFLNLSDEGVEDNQGQSSSCC